ncbi:hypothetical protein [Hymenobacter cellulosilyticus]|uniref:Uncharacterized protein n=1 Tax=Hymenobacter cellulosilyticus TaxID=2932248 RepID=A0A8T9QAP0_9BACT|nr:hypothetical protein [Hymenobacter cellulosilyticus]UOQ73208.1 hypothetical protein MUN79_04350 [Hymenobacter cellulosilyticus]
MSAKLASAIYFQNAAGQLLEDPAGFLRVNWSSGPRQLQDTKALFTHMASALKRRGWSRILIDQVGMLPFSEVEQRWVAEEWLPHAVVGGYRHGPLLYRLM